MTLAPGTMRKQDGLIKLWHLSAVFLAVYRLIAWVLPPLQIFILSHNPNHLFCPFRANEENLEFSIKSGAHAVLVSISHPFTLGIISEGTTQSWCMGGEREESNERSTSQMVSSSTPPSPFPVLNVPPVCLTRATEPSSLRVCTSCAWPTVHDFLFH